MPEQVEKMQDLCFQGLMITCLRFSAAENFRGLVDLLRFNTSQTIRILRAFPRVESRGVAGSRCSVTSSDASLSIRVTSRWEEMGEPRCIESNDLMKFGNCPIHHLIQRVLRMD